MTEISIYQLRKEAISLLPELLKWYKIFHFYILRNLEIQEIKQCLIQTLKKPLEIYISSSMNWLVKNNILFLYVLFDYSINQLLNDISTVKVIFCPDVRLNKKQVLDELTSILRNYSNKLPIKKIYRNLSALFSQEECQEYFNKNKLTIKQYCQLINISLAKFKRSK